MLSQHTDPDLADSRNEKSNLSRKNKTYGSKESSKNVKIQLAEKSKTIAKEDSTEMS
jgi:hypothetical protein